MLDQLKNRINFFLENKLPWIRSKPNSPIVEVNPTVSDAAIQENINIPAPIITRDGTLVDYQNGFNWIENKDLLRDEGVYYGLSQILTIPDEKLKAISSFFEEKIQSFIVLSQNLEKELTEIKIEIKELKEKKVENIDKIRFAELDFEYEKHDFTRNLLGFIAYGAILIFNYFIIYNWLKNNVEEPAITAAGLLVFGGLSLFNKFSVLYNPLSRVAQEEGYDNESWKTYVEEFLIPFVATSYIAYLGSPNKPLLQIFLFWLLIFTIFVFSGKAFLNVVIKLIKEFRVIRQNRNKKKANVILIKNLSADNLINEDKKKILSETEDKQKNLFLETNKQIARLLAEKETNISLFKSEFELARASRDV